jgi:hypothetical protein
VVDAGLSRLRALLLGGIYAITTPLGIAIGEEVGGAQRGRPAVDASPVAPALRLVASCHPACRLPPLICKPARLLLA